MLLSPLNSLRLGVSDVLRDVTLPSRRLERAALVLQDGTSCHWTPGPSYATSCRARHINSFHRLEKVVCMSHVSPSYSRSGFGHTYHATDSTTR